MQITKVACSSGANKINKNSRVFKIMFLLSKPSDAAVSNFLANVSNDGFSCSEVGQSLGKVPGGYNVDHNRILIGTGRKSFDAAKKAVRDWKMFDMPWVDLHRFDTPIEVGRDVAILIKHFGFYSINAARIVYVIDEADRFGFAYGTLKQHGEKGEERFTVEYNAKNDEVWYDILAFSRPNHLMAQLGYPLTRHLQHCFARDSKEAMFAACAKQSFSAKID